MIVDFAHECTKSWVTKEATAISGVLFLVDSMSRLEGCATAERMLSTIVKLFSFDQLL